jgi:hypothetical protein
MGIFVPFRGATVYVDVLLVGKGIFILCIIDMPREMSGEIPLKYGSALTSYLPCSSGQENALSNLVFIVPSDSLIMVAPSEITSSTVCGNNNIIDRYQAIPFWTQPVVSEYHGTKRDRKNLVCCYSMSVYV